MKKVTRLFCAGVIFMSLSMTAQANSLTYCPTYEIEGVSADVQQYAVMIGGEFNICPELLMAICYQESRCSETATNGSCKGLMQVNCSVHEDRFTEAGWTANEWSDGYKNMYVAASYLSELFEQYEDVGVVLSVYHGEKDAIKKAQSGQLSKYVREILERSEALERANGK